MDIKRKIEIVGQAVRSIAHHHDEDLAVREAALDQIQALVEAERTAARGRVQARIAAAVGPQQGEGA